MLDGLCYGDYYFYISLGQPLYSTLQGQNTSFVRDTLYSALQYAP